MAKFKVESELGLLVEKHLLKYGWEVYKEVVLPDGCRADLVAVRNNIIWIVETKLSASLSLFQQAHDRLRWAHYVSVATPLAYGNPNSVLDLFCKYYGIGWMQFYHRYNPSDNDECVVTFSPLLHRHRELKIVKKIDKLRKMLHPEQKESLAGTNGGHFTPYRNTINQVRNYLKQHGPSSMKDIIKGISHHYASDAGARSCLAKNLQTLHSDEFGSVIDGRKVLWRLK